MTKPIDIRERQICLNFDEEGAFAERLVSLLSPCVLEIVWTRNRSTMIAYRREAPNRLKLRLHRVFASAPDEIVNVLAVYILDRRDRDASQKLNCYIQERRAALHAEAPAARPVKAPSAKGAVYDLRQIFAELNEKYFHGAIKAKIGWSETSRQHRRRSIQLGSYDVESGLIRINRRLDSRDVPEFFLRSIVHHEMIHAILGIGRNGDRRSIHPPAFRQIEQDFKEHQLAREWEKRNLPLLLRAPKAAAESRLPKRR